MIKNIKPINYKILLCIILLLLYVIIVNFFQRIPITDGLSFRNAYNAKTVFHHENFNFDFKNIFSPGFLYVFIISIAYYFEDLKTSYIVIRLINSILIVISFFPLYLIFKRYISSNKSFYFSIITSLTPALLFYPFRFYWHNLFLPLLYFTILFFIKHLFNKDLFFTFLSGIFLSLLFYTSSFALIIVDSLFLLIVLNCFFNKYLRKNIVGNLSYYLLPFIIYYIILLPYVILNGFIYSFNIIFLLITLFNFFIQLIKSLVYLDFNFILLFIRYFSANLTVISFLTFLLLPIIILVFIFKKIRSYEINILIKLLFIIIIIYSIFNVSNNLSMLQTNLNIFIPLVIIIGLLGIEKVDLLRINIKYFKYIIFIIVYLIFIIIGIKNINIHNLESYLWIEFFDRPLQLLVLFSLYFSVSLIFTIYKIKSYKIPLFYIGEFLLFLIFLYLYLNKRDIFIYNYFQYIMIIITFLNITIFLKFIMLYYSKRCIILITAVFILLPSLLFVYRKIPFYKMNYEHKKIIPIYYLNRMNTYLIKNVNYNDKFYVLKEEEQIDSLLVLLRHWIKPQVIYVSDLESITNLQKKQDFQDLSKSNISFDVHNNSYYLLTRQNFDFDLVFSEGVLRFGTVNLYILK